MDKDDYKDIATLLQELQQQVKEHSREFFWFISQDVNRDSVGWPLLILSELKAIREGVESLSEQLSEQLLDVHERLDSSLGTPSHLQSDVENRLGKPLVELLKEREGKSIRSIAAELKVSKSTVSNWLKQFGRNHPREK